MRQVLSETNGNIRVKQQQNLALTHVYERIQSEIPNEAPQETPVQLEVTR